MKQLIPILFLVISFTCFSQTEIKIEDSKNHVGDSVRICTKIFGGKFLESAKGSPTFLNAGGNYPNARLTIVIWADVRKQFNNKPEEYYTGKQICVTGKIEMYKEKPQIVITSEAQIRELINDKLLMKEPQ